MNPAQANPTTPGRTPTSTRLRAYLRRNVLGLVALYLALGGTAWSAAKIDSKEISLDAVRAKHISDDAIRAKHIDKGEVRAPQLAANAVRRSELADNAVGKAELAPLSVEAGHLGPGSVDTSSVAPAAIGAGQLAPGSVGAEAIGPMSLQAKHIGFAIGALGSTSEADVVSNGGPQTLISDSFKLDTSALVVHNQAVQVSGNTDGTVEVVVLVDGEVHGIWKEDIAAGEVETISYPEDPCFLEAGLHSFELQVVAGNDDVTFEQAVWSATVLPDHGVSPSM